jgi:CHAT domain-containing protein
LKEALEIVGATALPPSQLARDLKSSGSRWQRKLAEQMEKRTRGPQEIGAESRQLAGFSSRWAWATVAAVALVAVGVGAYLRFGQASPEKLLAEAYGQQRTIELRINQAPYGPIRVQRDKGASQLNASSQLLEAEVAIKRRLVKQPENPDFLREKAEVDLLNWDYQPAIETLGHALRLQPQSFLITLDLGTAHFERAEAANSPADYEASLNYLGDAIRLEPGNSTALFNRAIVYERLYLYGRAIEDWEQFLKIEKDPGWRKEAEQRLQELRERQRQRGQRPSPEKLTLAQFTSDVKTGRAGAIEEYLEVAERQILPNIPPASSRHREDQNYQAARTLADALESAHGDWFLKDLLRGADDKDFQPAAKLLGKSSTANREGHSDEAYADAVRAGKLFRRSGNFAGFVAAGFEQAYALQFQSKAASCEAVAAKLVGTAFARSYVWLDIQLRLERAICSNMNREVGPAKNLTRQALRLAKEHDYKSFYLRGLTVLTTLESDAGNDANAWSAILEGLSLYWGSALPDLRAYSFYVALERIAERLDHHNVQFAAVMEAMRFRSTGSSRVVEASERMRLADAALRLGELSVAESQAKQAEQIFVAAPRTESTRWLELEARIDLARAKAGPGTDTRLAAAALLQSLPEVEHLSNQYVEFQYYDTLAELKIRSGDTRESERFLRTAIQIADDGLKSLPTWSERLAWMEQHRHPYVTLAELLFRSGSAESALAVWEHFRLADSGSLLPNGLMPTGTSLAARSVSMASESDEPAESRVITYAFAHDGLMVWVKNGEGLYSAYLQQPPQNVRRAAENLIAECARRDSDLADLRADAQYLYKSLIQPINRWLPSEGHIVVEPDGILGVVPLEVLMDAEGSYLGARYTITMASSVRAHAGPARRVIIRNSDRALIAAAPAGGDGNTTPAPGAASELLRVAKRFNKPLALLGRQVQVSRVGRELPKSSVFHFAGHAGLSRSGVAMLMADGILGPDQAHALEGRRLDRLKLAVFSACGTAKTSELSDSDSMVTAFLRAGANNVVASRWNVDSMATADFVDLFYGSLLSGASTAGALQNAAAAFRTMPERAHPYYWAAFAAFGRA